MRKPRARIRGGLPRMLVVMSVAAVANAGSADAQQIDQALSEAGKVWYDAYCTPCHGPGGAPGEAKYASDQKPVDLRTYVKRNDGKFPAGNWLAVISGGNPKGVHAPVWEKIKSDQTGTDSRRIAGRGVVAEIARYVVSVQTE